jgi:xylulokinase
MYLGLDIGTSSVKAALFDEGQRLVGQASHALEVRRPRPGWSEQEPEDWWRAVEATVDTLAAEHGLGGLRGIGLSGQMHGAVCLDAADRVMRPAILWNDGRSGAECAEIEAAFPRSREVSGNIAMAGFTAPKLQWLRKHEPEVFEHVSMVLLPKDYVRLRLTGHHVSEMSDAAGTLWLDVGLRDWSDDLLEASGLTRAQMPRLVEGSAPSGELRAELASRWGVRGPVVVAGGAGDNAAAAVRRGRGDAGLGLRLDRHLGRAVRFERAVLAEHRRGGARLLPRDPRDVAPDGGDPVGDGQSGVAVAHRGAAGRAARR